MPKSANKFPIFFLNFVNFEGYPLDFSHQCPKRQFFTQLKMGLCVEFFNICAINHICTPMTENIAVPLRL